MGPVKTLLKVDVAGGGERFSTEKLGGLGIVGAAMVVLVWLLERYGISMPAEVQAAVAVLLVTVGSGALAWWSRHRRAQEQERKVRLAEALRRTG